MQNLDSKKHSQISKFMTLILRHKPNDFSINLDKEGYCSIHDLVNTMNLHGKSRVTLEEILSVVENCSKQRFEMKNELIRARYGHSVDMTGYIEGIPPKILYHGTSKQFLNSIKAEGIKPMKRMYVHLSETEHFATLAAKRKKDPVLLKIDTEKSILLGTKFYYAGDEVWLSTCIHPDSILN